jgi:DNA-binding CsgD family transcriptional regulator
MRSRDLSPLQLQIVLHVANGMTLAEIAATIDRSHSHIQKQANRARRKVYAKTLPQLVSIVIASGQLEWSPQEDGRVLRQPG